MASGAVYKLKLSNFLYFGAFTLQVPNHRIRGPSGPPPGRRFTLLFIWFLYPYLLSCGLCLSGIMIAALTLVV
jgi:hypothetical protein